MRVLKKARLVVLDMENVQVSRLLRMYKMARRDLWPPMHSAADVDTWGREGGGVW